MDEVIFTFGSVTYASKAKKLLARASIPSKLMKLSGKDSCTHGLTVSEKDYYTAVMALREANIGYRVIKDGNGLF